MSNASSALPHYTYNDYLNWKGRWEIIYGSIIAKDPLPEPKHQRIAASIGGEFNYKLKQFKACNGYSPIDYKVAEDIIIQPDFLIVNKNIEKDFLDFPPDLVVEILSEQTVLIDRQLKFSIYESQQIKYYLIISPDKEEVEIYEYQHDAYNLVEKHRDFTFNFQFDEDCNVTIDFKEIW